MQPSDSFNIPRRSLDVEDYIDILRRHKSWIFGPFLFCLVTSVVGVYLWPDVYLSEAKIKITPQQVPESMVPSAVNQAIFDRIESMKQSIVSRATLTSIIQIKKLYPREVASKPMEDVIEEMRNNIAVAPLVSAGGNSKVIPAFVIQFKYENKYLAQQVVADLMSRFIDQNSKDMQGRAWASTNFMNTEAEQAKKDLDEIENRLTVFEVKNNGHLPDQAASNMTSLLALETQLTTLNGSISRATSDKLQTESQIRILQDQRGDVVKLAAEMPTQTQSAGAIQRNERLNEAETEVHAIEDYLRLLKTKDTDNHPDVVNARERLTAAQQKRDQLLKEDSQQKEEAKKEDLAKREAKSDSPARTNPVLARELSDRDARIKSLQSMAEAKSQEIEDLQKELKRTQVQANDVQGRLNSLPVGAKEYTDLLRDRDAAKQRYLSLDEKLGHAKQSQDMENNNQGEHLETLDTASLPTDPIEPKRPLVISIGAGIGLLLGIVIAGAREMKDTSLKNLKDVRAYTQMAVLGSIPLLENDFVVRRRKRLAWLGWTTACLVAVVVMVGAFVYYFANRGTGGSQ